MFPVRLRALLAYSRLRGGEDGPASATGGGRQHQRHRLPHAEPGRLLQVRGGHGVTGTRHGHSGERDLRQRQTSGLWYCVRCMLSSVYKYTEMQCAIKLNYRVPIRPRGQQMPKDDTETNALFSFSGILANKSQIHLSLPQCQLKKVGLVNEYMHR